MTSSKPLFLKEDRAHGSHSFRCGFYTTNPKSECFHVPLHWHEEIELVHFISGHFSLEINMEKYDIDSERVSIKPAIYKKDGKNIWVSFDKCFNVDNLTGLNRAFRHCHNLIRVINIPNTVELMNYAFEFAYNMLKFQRNQLLKGGNKRGFIKAEVVNYKDLLEQGSLPAAREKGLVGIEGKDYVVKDGDVILFRFNV